MTQSASLAGWGPHTDGDVPRFAVGLVLEIGAEKEGSSHG